MEMANSQSVDGTVKYDSSDEEWNKQDYNTYVLFMSSIEQKFLDFLTSYSTAQEV